MSTTTLITGANKGLGFETARQLIAVGHTVWAGARTQEKAEQAAKELGARPLVVTSPTMPPCARRPSSSRRSPEPWTCW